MIDENKNNLSDSLVDYFSPEMSGQSVADLNFQASRQETDLAGAAFVEPQNHSSELTHSIVIQQFASEQLLSKELSEQYRLPELIMEGYGLPGDQAYAQLQLGIEYARKPGGTGVTFLALDKDRRAVGSLSYTDLDLKDAGAGQFFAKLNELRTQFPILAAAVLDNNENVLYTRGFVIHPGMQEKGLGKRLIAEAFRSLQPAIVLGETKTPAAVAVRAGTEGYSTYYGRNAVTPGIPESYTGIEPVVQAFLASVSGLNEHFVSVVGETNSDGIFYEDTDYLVPDIPEPRSGREEIVKSFVPVIAAQEKMGSRATAVAPLISIRRDLLPKNI